MITLEKNTEIRGKLSNLISVAISWGSKGGKFR